MAEVDNNIFVRGLSGSLGRQFVIRRTRSGKTIVTNMPTFDPNREFSQSQLAQQSAFKQASRYAKAAQRQPVYAEKAKANHSTGYNMAIQDWFGKPEVLRIDVQGYSGQAGQTIRAEADDDTLVARLRVVIHNNGVILEEGEAVRSESDPLVWSYVTTNAVQMSPKPLVDAHAYDLPGNIGGLSVYPSG